MADGSIDRQDIITDDAIQAPLILSANFQVLLETVDNILQKMQEFQGLGDAPYKGPKKGTDDLTEAQKQLAKVQQQIAVEVAKNNDEYRAYTERLIKVKEETKLNQAQTDSWRLSVNQQNSSIVQLTKALNDNRVAYANLRTEGDRTSASGQALLKTIQAQDTSVKALRDSMGQSQLRVGGYREEIAKLLPVVGQVAPQLEAAGESALSFAARAATINPVLGLIAAAAVVASSGLIAYFTRTAEGEEDLAVATSEFGAIWDVVMNGIADGAKFAFGTAVKYLNVYLGILSTNAIIAGILSREEHELKKREIQDIVDKARADAESTKLIFEAREKLSKSDQDRFDALKKGEAVLKAQADIDIKIATDKLALTKQIIANERDGRELRLGDLKQIADAEAHLADTTAQYEQGARRRQQLESTLVQEVINKSLAGDKVLQEARLTADETFYQHYVDLNARIVGNQKFTVEEQITAETDLVNAKINLNDIANLKLIQQARETAFQRVQLNSKELESINTAAAGDLNKLVQLTIAAKQRKLESDADYIAQTKAITTKGVEQDKQIVLKGRDEMARIISDNASYFVELKKRFAQEDLDNQLIALNKQMNAGEISLRQYEAKKFEIEQNAAQTNLKVQGDEYADEIRILQKYLDTHLDLDQKSKDILISQLAKYKQAELDLTTKADERILTEEKKVTQLRLQLQTQLFTTATTLGDNFYQAKQQQIQDNLSAIQTEEQAELAAAGNNANAKLEIQARFNALTADENKKLKKAQHDQAVFDQVMAIFQIGVKTAEAVAAALPLLAVPATAALGAAEIDLVEAIGAAEIAAVLAKPIPSYFTGVDSSPATFANIAEHGPELAVHSGKATLYDTPMVTFLNAGTKVYDADETAQILNSNTFNPNFPGSQKNNSSISVSAQLDDSRIVKSINRMVEQLPDVIAQGAELLKVYKTRNGNRKWIRSKIFLGDN